MHLNRAGELKGEFGDLVILKRLRSYASVFICFLLQNTRDEIMMTLTKDQKNRFWKLPLSLGP